MKLGIGTLLIAGAAGLWWWQKKKEEERIAAEAGAQAAQAAGDMASDLFQGLSGIRRACALSGLPH